MTKYEDVQTAFTAFDESTTALGGRIQLLIDEINRTATDGLNGPQTEFVLTTLAAFKTNLDAMGRNQTIPPTPPTTGEIPGPLADGSNAPNSGRTNPNDPNSGRPNPRQPR